MPVWAVALTILGAMGAVVTIVWAIDTWLLPEPVIRSFILRLFKKKYVVPERVVDLDKAVKQSVIPKANIVFGQPSTAIHPQFIAGGSVPFFCYIPIWNDPNIRTNEASARTVFAIIKFYNGNQLVLEMDRNCWRSSRREDISFMSMAELTASGLRFLLYIAIKYAEDSHCYFPTCSSMSSGGREDTLKLDYSELNVEVRLQGLNMDDVSRKYVLRNFGKGGGIELLPSS